MVKLSEVTRHNTKNDCWVIIHGKVYDVSDFLPEHPGGQKIILRFAGKDATKKFEPIHPGDTLEKYLPKEKFIGVLEKDSNPPSKKTDSVQISNASPPQISQQPQQHQPIQPQPQQPQIYKDEDGEQISEDEYNRLQLIQRKPPLSLIYNLYDFEFIASKTMPKTAWAYYSSGADDEITMRENRAAYQRLWFRPRVLVDVSKIDLSTKMLGTNVDAPFYVTATALGKLGHPEGEKNLTRAAAKHNLIQMIPTLASCSFDEIVDAAVPEQTQWLQLYVNANKEITKKIVQHAEKRGIKGLFITVDAPQLGRREKDMRSKYDEEAADIQGEQDDDIDRTQGAARAISSFIDPALNWNDVPFFKEITKMPIALKGVQRWEDAVKAVEHGIDSIVLSNHGGRQLDYARSGIEVLIEVMDALKSRGLEKKIEVYIDGGVRRATDIIKAICLGAKGVGLGRPFLYAMSTYGEAGVAKAMQLLKDEMEMNFRLLGVSKVSELTEDLLDIKAITTRQVPDDKLYQNVYEQLDLPSFKAKL